MRVVAKVVLAIHLITGFAQSQGFAAESFQLTKPCPDVFCVPKARIGGPAILVAGETARVVENDQSSPKIAPPTYIPPSTPNDNTWLKLVGYLLGTIVAPIVLIALVISLWSTRFAKRRYSKVLVGILSAIVTLPLGFVSYSLILWIATFIDPASAQDDCILSSVSKAEYRQLLAQAKTQDWTVWPGLSNGFFRPWSPRFVPPSNSLEFERGIGERLKRAIEELSFDRSSGDAQLAAAHAVMRSIHAEFVSVMQIRSFHAGNMLIPTSVHFRYFLRQRRFAPLCLPCLLFPFTTMQVVFYQEPSDSRYSLHEVVVIHGNLKYDPHKEGERNAICPEFPARSQS